MTKRLESLTKTIQFIPLTNGKTLLMYKGYTFNKNQSLAIGYRYNCAAWTSKKCRAYVNISEDKTQVINSKDFHTHPPTVYRALASGFYFKVC
ncbi:hypothetical protein JYU34_004333 [Plutella xylostella]|uniref:FLYWCH-type domain-containing protein n=1 Tax=Plutella xylostella TaxID=51655 RepID=A0ABQ7QXR0_PLUXY|nr:hypothetical protein JYU34_004333 [Plutella xylostella]